MEGDRLTLLDWRRRIFDLYAVIRSADPRDGWNKWREVRDEMFATHPQSPLRDLDRAAFAGLSYYDYNDSYRVLGKIEPAKSQRYEIGTSGDGSYAFDRFAVVTFTLGDRDHSLELYWLEGYGGGLFLPFRDATAGMETYGPGATYSTRLRGPTSVISMGSSCSISTSPTTRPAVTTLAGFAHWLLPRID